MKQTLLIFVLTLAAALGGCFNLSPAYAPPTPPGGMPVAFKEDKGWVLANPADSLDRGRWWAIFQEPELDGLMAQLERANQNIAVAAANLRQARAQIGIARSALFPFFSAPAAATRQGAEGGSASARWSYGASAQWEISFWNAVPALEAAQAQAQGQAADFATMRLSMQADMAQAYFELRALDGQISLYEDTIKAYEASVRLTDSQYRHGLVTRVDLDQAETQLADAQAQLAALMRRRAEYEHAIAILVGRMPSSFSLPRGSLAARVPIVPPALPSALLERRPDVASAERAVAAANQQIGMARAAWLPTLNLGGDIIDQALSWRGATLYSWSLGPSAALSLFEGGRRLAESESAWAAYEAEVARYRQTVLDAVKDVEDNLSALRWLENEAEARGRAVRSSRSALRLAMSQYEGGLTTYLQVVSSQTTALANERAAIEVQGARLSASVGLIKALGGGFERTDLPFLLADPPRHGKE